MCEKCPSGVGAIDEIYDIEGGEGVIPFVEHIFYLENLSRVGATFNLNDLTKEEWDGLIILKRIQNEVETELMEREHEKQRMQQAMAVGRHSR